MKTIIIALFLASNSFALDVTPKGAPSITDAEGNITISGSLTLGTDLSVPNGGTGASSFTDGGILFGNGTSAIGATGVLTNGQLLIGDGTEEPTAATLTATANETTVSNGAGSITIGLPDDVTITGSLTAGAAGTPLAVISTGTYTAVDSANSNLDSCDPATMVFTRLGNIVDLRGAFNADPTTTATSTSFELSIPIASNFSTDEDAFCVGSNAIGEPIVGIASAANDTIVFQWKPVGVANIGHRFHCTYVIK